MFTLSTFAPERYTIMKNYSYFESEIGFIGSRFCWDVMLGFMLLTCIGTPLYYCVEVIIYELSK